MHTETEILGHFTLEQIAEKWDRMTATVVNVQQFSLAEMQDLLKETYAALNAFHKDALIPKGIGRILLNIEEFLYFASLIEEKEVGEGAYCCREIYVIAKALKEGFFKGEYPAAYPKLQMYDDFRNVHVIDMEGHFLPF